MYLFMCKQMKNKNESEKMEEQLLEFFDYAWNRRGNGTCRREEILLKLDNSLIRSNSRLFNKFDQWMLPPFSKKLGIKVNAGLPLEVEPANKTGFLPQILKFVKSRPRLVQLDDSLYQDEEICGVAIGNGNICRNKPVLGRKRCSEHKGKRITGITHVTTSHIRMPEDESSVSDVYLDDNKHQIFSDSKLLNPVGGPFYRSVFNFDQECDTCGVAFGDGSVCRNRSVPGSRRCELHKGQRVTKPKSLTIKAEWLMKGMHGCSLDEEYFICGVVSGDGSVCRSRPVPGRKRCELHKGQRITEPKSLTIREGWSATGMHKLISEPDDELDICGVVTGNGHVCRRKPVPGRKRCEEHKGKRITGSGLTTTSISSSRGTERSSVCGVYLDDGSICTSSPVSGRKRCALHKGRRVS